MIADRLVEFKHLNCLKGQSVHLGDIPDHSVCKMNIIGSAGIVAEAHGCHLLEYILSFPLRNSTAFNVKEIILRTAALSRTCLVM